MLVAPVWGGKLITMADDLSIAPDLVLNGFYDGPFTNFLLRTIKPGNRCVDVGANLGTFSVLMGKLVGPNGHVYAYEASPHIHPLLRENVELNYMSNWIEIIDRAAYSHETKMQFFATLRFQGNGSLVAHSDQYKREYSVDDFVVHTVLAETLDTRIGEGTVDLVKIDVEGAEPHVFAGMTGLLEARRVKYVAFELLRERIQEQYDEFGQVLRMYASDGWRYHTISDEGELVPLGVEYMLAVGSFGQVVMIR